MSKLFVAISLLLFSHSSIKAQIQSTPKSTYISQHVGLPLDEMKAALEARQKMHDAEVKDCQAQVLEVYESVTSFPAIQSGWRKVNVLGLGICNETKAFVKDGKVNQIVMGDTYHTVSLCTVIQNGKCTVGLADAQTKQSYYFKVIFLEDLLK